MAMSLSISKGARFVACLLPAAFSSGRKVYFYLGCDDYVSLQNMAEEDHHVVRLRVVVDIEDWLL